MKKLLLLLIILFTLSLSAQAQTICDKSVVINVASGTTGQLVAITTGSTVYVCGFVISGDTLATTAQFVTGTGTTCGTGTVNLTGAMRLCDECAIAIGSGVGIVFQGNFNGAVCLTTATGVVTGILTFKIQ